MCSTWFSRACSNDYTNVWLQIGRKGCKIEINKQTYLSPGAESPGSYENRRVQFTIQANPYFPRLSYYLPGSSVFLTWWTNIGKPKLLLSLLSPVMPPTFVQRPAPRIKDQPPSDYGNGDADICSAGRTYALSPNCSDVDRPLLSLRKQPYLDLCSLGPETTGHAKL